MMDIFKKSYEPLPYKNNDDLIYAVKNPAKQELQEIEKSFARVFATPDGERVLGHLQTITFQRALGAGAADEQLRYLEGQRAMVASILRLIDRGCNPQ